MNSPQETQLGAELRHLVSNQPFTPDLEAIGQRARQRHHRGRVLRGASAAAAAAVVAGGVFVAVHGTGSTAAKAPAASSPSAAQGSPLLSLAADIKASSGPLPGDASLIISTQTIGGRQMEVLYNLYTDNGDYYVGDSKQGLVTAVDQKANLDDGSDAREVAAAQYAAAGDLTSARVKMATAQSNPLGIGLSPAERQKIWDKGRAQAEEIIKEKGAHVTIPANPPTGPALQEAMDNYVWNNSVDALAEGGGDPQVREGVLRLLSTVSGVSVTSTTTNGQATLTLTAGPEVFGGTGKQVLIIGATTGMPINSWVGDLGPKVAASVTTYQASRVTLSGIESGQF